MKTAPLYLLALLLTAGGARAEEPTPAVAAPATAPAPAAANPEAVDISDLEQDYWRPNKDELEVVQNRRFEKKGRFELAVHYGIYQGKDYVNSRSVGASLTYNLTNEFFVEASHHKVSNEDNDLLNSIRQTYNFTPDFNREQSQSMFSVGWTPIYAKFSLLGKKISHFEMYLAPGIGNTKTLQNNLSGHLTIGQKFFVNDHLLFRIEWRMTRYTERVNTPQGATSVANGGPGFVDRKQANDNIIFGLGWMF